VEHDLVFDTGIMTKHFFLRRILTSCPNPFDYSSATEYIVIVMVALADELLALPTLLAASLLGMLVSATEVSVSPKPSRTNPARRIAGMTIVTSLFTSTHS